MLFRLSYVRVSKSLRQESNPHLGRTKGACLPLTLRRQMETAGIEPTSCSVQARGALPEHVPVRCGRMESNHHSARQRRYKPLSSPMLSVRGKGDRPDSNRRLEAHNLGCCRYTTATMHGDDRTRTGGLSPDKRVLCTLSYAPERVEGGIGSPQPEAETLPSDISGASCCPSALLPTRVRVATSSPVGPGGLSKPAAR